MPEVRTTNLRFNLGKESHRKAWQYLQTMDKSVFKSYSQAVATAVVDWEKQYKYKNTAGVSAWLTPTQAAREPVWERCSKPRNSGGKTRCVRDGTARSSY